MLTANLIQVILRNWGYTVDKNYNSTQSFGLQFVIVLIHIQLEFNIYSRGIIAT
jgi:hypothetical protein